MTDRIKITMLGTSGSGKTCYMVSMYKMMSTGIGLNGFTLSAEDPDDNTRFSELWKQLTDCQGNERWPLPTTEETLTYGMNFNYSYKPVLKFDWFDYRGDALIDYTDVPDVGELRQRLSQTSCVFLCISGEHFKEKVKPNDYDKIGVGAINQLMAHTHPNNSQNYPPAVVIVLTKYDLCSHRERDILGEIKDLFSTLFSQGTKWLVMICPITLGQELATDKDRGEIDPVNVHLPVIFSMLAELLRESEELNGQITGHRQNLEKMTNNILSRWFKNNDINRTHDEVKFLNSRLSEITTKIYLLTKQLSNRQTNTKKIQLFFDGRELKINDFIL